MNAAASHNNERTRDQLSLEDIEREDLSFYASVLECLHKLPAEKREAILDGELKRAAASVTEYLQKSRVDHAVRLLETEFAVSDRIDKSEVRWCLSCVLHTYDLRHSGSLRHIESPLSENFLAAMGKLLRCALNLPQGQRALW